MKLDQKHYSTETVPGSDDYVMAGTIYNGSDYNSIHFLYFTSNTLTLEKTYSSFVEGGSANDLRVVDIAVTEGADGPMFYITALLRHVNSSCRMTGAVFTLFNCTSQLNSALIKINLCDIKG